MSWYNTINCDNTIFIDLEHVDNCTQCDRGRFCDTPGLLESRGPCDAGYLCYGGAYTSGPIDNVTGKFIGYLVGN